MGKRYQDSGSRVSGCDTKGSVGLIENKGSKQLRALGKQISGVRALQAEETAEQRPGGGTITGTFDEQHRHQGTGAG